jgi:ribosomal protein L12E/L44/L45/RPP1/RPP2
VAVVAAAAAAAAAAAQQQQRNRQTQTAFEKGQQNSLSSPFTAENIYLFTSQLGI